MSLEADLAQILGLRSQPVMQQSPALSSPRQAFDSALVGNGLPDAPVTPKPEYRFLDGLNLMRIDTPMDGRGYAETWPIGEEGTPEFPRPAEIPMDRHGIQVFRPHEWSEHDTAGEALHIDPIARSYNKRFAATLSPAQRAELKKQPDYEMSTQETPERAMENAVDAAMRGYLVGQWPAEAVQRFFTPKQRALLDQLKRYMQTGQQPK